MANICKLHRDCYDREDRNNLTILDCDHLVEDKVMKDNAEATCTVDQ